MFKQLEKVMKGMLRAHSLRETRETPAPKSIAAAIVAMMMLKKKFARKLIAATAAATALVALAPQQALAVPAFARQTGQNCVACHAGGQFPELTPYGRLFKLTGYTIGERELPLSMMAVVTATKQKVNDPAAGKTQDGSLIFNTGSLFIAGKISDRVGGFVQITYNNYDSQDPNTGAWAGHSGSDNLDIRYADHLIDNNRDFIYGVTLNNNPGVQDVFHSVPAWGPATVPGSTGPGNGLTPILDNALGAQAAGIGTYAYWNKTVYAELTGYKTGDGVFSFMTQGNGGQVYLKGTNPYTRLALTKEWGPHNAMIGLTHFDVHQYEADLSSPTDHYRDNGIDAQYQYLLDPYTLTATIARIHEIIDYGSGNPSDTINSLRAKASFTYQAKYGATLSYFSMTNTLAQESRGWTPEVFWTPIQNVRLGLQYTMFNKNDGVTDPRDPTGASFLGAKDTNTLFFYVWGAY
jgi:hypothetical protein